MTYVKKLTFAPLFLAVFILLIYLLTPLLKSYDFVFSLSINTLFYLITLSALIFLSCFIFALFITLSQDFKFSLPVILLAALLPFPFFEPALAIIFAVAIFIVLLLINLSLDSSLRSYLTFQPSTLLGPAIKNLSRLLILSFCLVYFFSTSKIIAQNGFQIPDALIDTALKMTPAGVPAEENSLTQLPTIPPDQIEFLKQNPDLLKQSGLDPKILDSLSNPSKSTPTPPELNNDLIKQTVKEQVQGFLEPYLNFIPAVLALLLFLTLQSLTSIFSLLVYPLLWITFLILEKTGFVKFEIEQRPVRKMAV